MSLRLWRLFMLKHTVCVTLKPSLLFPDLTATLIFTATGKDCAPTSFQAWWVHSVVRVSSWEGLELGFVQ